MTLAGFLELGFEPAGCEPRIVEAGWSGDSYALAVERAGMGTRVGISLRTDSSDRAGQAVDRAFALMDRLIGLLNRYDGSSALSVLNAAGSLADSPPELTGVLDLALRLGDRTSGAFDPTVAPLVDVYGGGVPRVPPGIPGTAPRAAEPGLRMHPAPDARDLSDALALIGREHVRRDGRKIELAREGMRLTLDGVAKGWIVDALAESLEVAGIADYLVDAGGDIRAAGRPEPGRVWTVAVQDPELRDEWPDIVGLTSGAVATSGNYEFYFDPGRTRHHIVAGKTGESPAEAASVTVSAPEAAAADALATAVFVLGPRSGLRLIQNLPDCECLVISAQGARSETSGWAALSLQGR
jgi:thiamine biosynthesis lipoprotein